MKTMHKPGRQCSLCEGFCLESPPTEPCEKVVKVRPDLGRLVNEIKRVVYEQKGSISVTEAIGAIELAKLEIIGEQQ